MQKHCITDILHFEKKNLSLQDLSEIVMDRSHSISSSPSRNLLTIDVDIDSSKSISTHVAWVRQGHSDTTGQCHSLADKDNDCEVSL